ncbi:MAG: YqaJ viral recombinase family protein [Planctomycetaceae bacterium]|nr:YqaJ viral recombinase family protein [Planctomycetaceae bacterium]
MDRSHMKVIGGSTIAGILGKSPWETPYSIWLKLTGKLQPGEETDAMARGHALEPVVAAMYAANHPEFQVEPMGTIYHDEHPFIVGSPDRVLIREGELVAGLEIKTANIVTANEWGEEDTDLIPQHYLLQAMWYCGLLHVPVWYVAVGFVPAERRKIITYREYEVCFNPDMFGVMLRQAVRFWKEHVETDTPPPITEPNETITRYLRYSYPRHEAGKWLESTPEVNALAERLVNARETLDAAEKDFELCKTLMISALGDAEGVTTDAGKITYRASKPTFKTDWQAVADSLSPPQEIVNQFTKEVSGSRRFLLQKGMGK